MNNLYDAITSITNIQLAIKKLKKTYKDLDVKATRIQNMLMDPYSYIPKEYRSKEITNGKKTRVISIAKIYPDKIIHHAIMNVLAPILSAQSPSNANSPNYHSPEHTS